MYALINMYNDTLLKIITFTYIIIIINTLPLENNATKQKLSVKEMVIIYIYSNL